MGRACQTSTALDRRGPSASRAAALLIGGCASVALLCSACGRIGFDKTSLDAAPDAARPADAAVSDAARLDAGEAGDSGAAACPAGSFCDASQIAAGTFHTCAVQGARAVCWGAGTLGQLGDGAMTSRSAPVAVMLAARAIEVRAGDRHTCVRTGVGEVWCWGDNVGGQLGDGTTTASPLPVAVAGVTGATRLALGGSHSCAEVAGGVLCWGLGTRGQLGDATMTSRSVAALVVGAIALPVRALCAGDLHSCVVDASGAVSCWGANLQGELGDGTLVDRSMPVAVSLPGPASDVVCGAHHSCAVLDSGAVWCWGRNVDAQLGDGTTTMRETPVAVTGLTEAAQAVAAGGLHTCALGVSGDVRCWGGNASGQLGDGTGAPRATTGPVIVSGAGAVTAGQAHTCSIAAGAVRCWGDNAQSQLGDGTPTGRLAPVDVLAPPP